MNKNTTPGVPAAGRAQGGREEPELAQEDDIPSDDGGGPQAGGDPVDPEKGAVPVPPPGKSDHPRQPR